jgi:excinuclease ABC subunit A
LLRSVSRHYGIDMDTPFKDLSAEHKKIILYGTGSARIDLTHQDFKGRHMRTYRAVYKGVIPVLKSRYESSSSDLIKGEVEKYMTAIPCSACNGARLKPFVLAVKIDGKSIYDVCSISVEKAYEFISSLFLTLNDYQMKIAKKLLEEIRERLKFLLDVGLGYLTLARSSNTLSGGEAQRIRLATQIGSGLSGVLYVLDEPSIGLHQVNNEKLLNNTG